MALDPLRAVVNEAETHFRTVCSFSNAKPMRAAVDVQSFDDLKPGVLQSFELLEWYTRLCEALVAVVKDLATSAAGPETETVAPELSNKPILTRTAKVDAAAPLWAAACASAGSLRIEHELSNLHVCCRLARCSSMQSTRACSSSASSRGGRNA